MMFFKINMTNFQLVNFYKLFGVQRLIAIMQSREKEMLSTSNVKFVIEDTVLNVKYHII